MTVNVGLITNEALVLGCDSIASSMAYYLDPFDFILRDKKDIPIEDKDDKITAKFEYSDLTRIVTNALGGVTKIFEISSKPAPAAALTSGMAKLNNRTIRNIAEEFFYSNDPNGDISSICNDFFKFFRKQYELNYKDATVPEEFWEELQFLVGGYGVDDTFPSLFRINVKTKTVDLVYSEGKCGLAWGGLSEGVERLIFGYDGSLRRTIEIQMEEYHKSIKNKTISILEDVLSKLRVKSDYPDLIYFFNNFIK